MKGIPLLFGWRVIPPRICCNVEREMTCDKWDDFMSWLKKKHPDIFMSVGWAIIEYLQRNYKVVKEGPK